MIASFLLVTIAAAAFVWGIQPYIPPWDDDDGDGWTPIYVCDVTIHVQGDYNDFSIGTQLPWGTHVISDWGYSASASNWHVANNLELLTIPAGHVIQSWPSIASIWGDKYTVELTISFLQYGFIAKDFDGNSMSYKVSFTVDMPALQTTKAFSESFKFGGVLPGQYVIRIAVSSGQYIDINNSPVKDMQFTQTFTKP